VGVGVEVEIGGKVGDRLGVSVGAKVKLAVGEGVEVATARAGTVAVGVGWEGEAQAERNTISRAKFSQAAGLIVLMWLFSSTLIFPLDQIKANFLL
jgi:hypothetical protein